MSKHRNGNGRRSKGTLVGHLFPVRHTSGDEKPDGWLLCVTPEDGDIIALPDLDQEILDTPKELRSRLENGLWWISEERLDLDSVRDMVDEIGHEDHWDDVVFCEDCMIADADKGCGVFGDIDQRGFVPRPPPAPTLDAEAVSAMASMLLEADEAGLAFELMQAAMARFCALRPRPMERQDLKITIKEAAEILEVEWPSDRATVDDAFRKATHKHHPDKPGGSAEAMKRAIDAKMRLHAALEQP